MKFIITITHGREFEGTCTEYVPVEYDSIEALYVDLNKAILDGKKADHPTGWFAIMTLDQFFKNEYRAD